MGHDLFPKVTAARSAFIWKIMANRFDSLPNRRAIIDRRGLADALAGLAGDNPAALRAAATPLLREALDQGRAEIARRLAEKPSHGTEIAASYAYLTDQLLRLCFDFTLQRLYRNNHPTASERIVLIAVGGYGRGEMALYSDIDIAFITPWKQTGWVEQVIESILYMLWDLGLKVGHSSRSLDDMVRMAKGDLTICTALLESRYVWGDQALYEEAAARFDRDVRAGSARSFVAAKLAERNERHERMGDSRYVVEPNLKEGKGGCAISTRCSGSANMCTRSRARPNWSTRACSPRTNIAASAAPRISCGRCAAISTSTPSAPRIG